MPKGYNQMNEKPESFSTKPVYNAVTASMSDRTQVLYRMLVAVIGATQGQEALSHHLCRDKTMDMLRDAVEGAFQTFDGEELYSTPFDKACHIAYTIIHDHPAKDGNKRLGMLAFFVCGCYFNNGLGYTMPEDKFVKDALCCAAGRITKTDFWKILYDDCKTDYDSYPFTSAIYDITAKDYWTGVEAMTSAYIEKFRKALVELS